MFPFGFGKGGYAPDPSDPTYRLRENSRILERAKRKNGVTTSWKVSHEIKKVCQKFNVADGVTLKPTPGKGIQIVLPKNLEAKAGGYEKLAKFVNEMVDVAEECGYKVSVAEGYVELSKVDE